MCPSHNTPPQLSLPIHLSSWTWTRDALGIRNPGARFRNLSTADPFSAHSATVHTFGVMITYIQVALAIAIIKTSLVSRRMCLMRSWRAAWACRAVTPSAHSPPQSGTLLAHMCGGGFPRWSCRNCIGERLAIMHHPVTFSKFREIHTCEDSLVVLRVSETYPDIQMCPERGADYVHGSRHDAYYLLHTCEKVRCTRSAWVFLEIANSLCGRL